MRRTAAAFAAVLGLIILGGCANPLDELSESGVEKLVEEGMEAGSEGGDIDFDIDVDGDGGAPSGWPSEVPVPEGSVVMSAAVDETWTMMVTTTTETIQAYIDTLTAAGFESSSEADFGGIQGGTFTSDNYTVTIAVIAGEGTDESSMSVSVGTIVE